jgi:hypothetical protein
LSCVLSSKYIVVIVFQSHVDTNGACGQVLLIVFAMYVQMRNHAVKIWKVTVCLGRGISWSIVILTLTFCIWFREWNELIHHHLISYRLIISICMRNWLVSLKFMG